MPKPRLLFIPDYAGIRSTAGGDRIGGGMFPAAPRTIAGLEADVMGVSRNSGNMIHTEAAAKTFDFERSHSCFGNFPAVTPDFDIRAGAADIERRFDAVIVSFDNIIRRTYPDAAAAAMGQRFEATAAYLEALKIPVYVIGIGIQSAPEPGNTFPPLLRVLTAANRHAALFAVRGLATRDWLHSVGLTNAKALGCPSLFAFPKNIFAIRAAAHSEAARVGTAGHLGAGARKAASVEMLKRITAETTADYVFQNDLFPLTRPNRDADAYDEATSTLHRSFIEPIIRRGARWDGAMFAGYYYFREPGRWRVYAAHRDYYFGDRFHGGVAFLQAGKPALIAGQDDRVRELTSFFDLPYADVEEAANAPVAAMIADRLSESAIARFHATYAKRLADYVAVCEAAGLQFQDRPVIADLLETHG